MLKIRNSFLFAVAMMLLASLISCDKSESYSDLLKAEEKSVNWFLAQHRVETSFPTDGSYEVGNDAPFYRMDDDGYLYLQVINAGDLEDQPKVGDRVYFRYNRKNIKQMYEGSNPPWMGNMDNLSSSGFTSFFKGNTVYPSSAQFGSGIQVPMDYLGYYSEVNLVLRSYYGFPDDQSSCIPYIINIKYYKPEY